VKKEDEGERRGRSDSTCTKILMSWTSEKNKSGEQNLPDQDQCFFCV
jgi:hypothetical protein